MQETQIRVDVDAALQEHQDMFKRLEGRIPEIKILAQVMASCILRGGKIIWMGNGGSASQSQHFATELVGRFKLERKALASVSLTADTAVLTAIGNDYGFDEIFSRQIEALGNPGDIAVGISTSGNSENVVVAMRLAKELGVYSIGLTGGDGGKLKGLCDLCFVVPSSDTPRIQEAHLWIGHTLCHCIEDAVVASMQDA